MRAYVSLAPSRTSPHPTSPSLVSTRIRGHVKGAPVTTATRRSVILRADGSDARLTPAWTKVAAASAAAFPLSAMAPAAPRPSVLKNERRATTRFMATSVASAIRENEIPEFLVLVEVLERHPSPLRQFPAVVVHAIEV